jgi:hypothetical protein
MGFEQKTASIDKIMGTDWKRHCGFIKKNDAFNEVYLDQSFDKYFDVINKKRDFLGRLVYFGKWKKWVWQQDEDIIMSDDCLQEIVDFLISIKKESPRLFEESKELLSKIGDNSK